MCLCAREETEVDVSLDMLPTNGGDKEDDPEDAHMSQDTVLTNGGDQDDPEDVDEWDWDDEEDFEDRANFLDDMLMGNHIEALSKRRHAVSITKNVEVREETGNDAEPICWTKMENIPGWDTKAKIKETLDEAENSEFLNRLLNQITKIGTVQASYNTALQQFVAKQENAQAYLSEHMQTSGSVKRKAIFVLGPSSAGKSSVVASIATLIGDPNAIQYPVMTVDGADWREASLVWANNAKQTHIDSHGQGCYLTDYFKNVFEHVKKPMNQWMMKQITTYWPNTVIIPSTAVPCVFPSKVKTCKISKIVNAMRELNFEIQFVVLHANRDDVIRMGLARQSREGKKYSPEGYELAYMSAMELRNYYKKDTWYFFYNSFEANTLPRRMTAAEYWDIASPIVQRVFDNIDRFPLPKFLTTFFSGSLQSILVPTLQD